ncbi:heterodisulfide reductase-related iron-sulfur binding cluster [Magnetofaba australis]|uniref:Putative Fe-S oxidoreductase n=1 Tax=Magnetofaba australis IT-1 TaxID=1434232 RepID=A0A1Y2K067_9PROT|nr:heterodisulfide reductase-related iron-sulfur binding cluster [Magnetofaba australis]OSM01421.1 putative Fe-S oxidoreductase [Magnetofaba australis IT-1]
MADGGKREGNLEQPLRHPVEWTKPDFFDAASLEKEMDRVFEICHGCRRCFSLCQAFPTLFDAIDDSEEGELDDVDKGALYPQVVDNCYLCDLCFMTKCPYVPPHEWGLDFPHLMLRAKAQRFKQGGFKFRDKLLTSTDLLGSIAGIPVVAQTVNFANNFGPTRKALEAVLGVDAEATLPPFHSNKLRHRLKNHVPAAVKVEPCNGTKGRVALFGTCYANNNMPELGEDLLAVLEHNGIPVRLTEKERCCGMPKLELGDLESVQEAKEANIPVLAALVDEGWDLIAPVPSCVLMFKMELPLLFPDDKDVKKVAAAFYDPFEYLMLRHKGGLLNTDFKKSLGKVIYHAPCHQRVQNIGLKTRDVLQLIPDTTVEAIERCSGHDGTYAVKKEFHASALKILRPVARKVTEAKADYYGSDCPIGGRHIAHNGIKDGTEATPPISLLRIAYGI